MYRNIGDNHEVPEVDGLFEMVDGSVNNYTVDEDQALMDVHEDHQDEESEDEEIYNSEVVRRKFEEAFDEYKKKILLYHVENPQDPSANKGGFI